MDSYKVYIAITHVANILSALEESFSKETLLDFCRTFVSESKEFPKMFESFFATLPIEKVTKTEYKITPEGCQLSVDTLNDYLSYLKNNFIPNPYLLNNNKNKKYSLEFFEKRMLIAAYYLQSIKDGYCQSDLFKITIKMCGVDDELNIRQTIKYHDLVINYLLPATKRILLSYDEAQDKYWLDSDIIEYAKFVTESSIDEIKNLNINKNYIPYLNQFLKNPGKRIKTKTLEFFEKQDQTFWNAVLTNTKKRIYKLDTSIEDSYESCVQEFVVHALEHDKIRIGLVKLGEDQIDPKKVSFWVKQNYCKKKQRKFKNERLDYTDMNILANMSIDLSSNLDYKVGFEKSIERIMKKLSSNNCEDKTITRFKKTIELLASGCKSSDIVEKLGSTKVKVEHDIFRIRKIIGPLASELIF